ncbi:hypothetical protein [Streptomyces sp. NBC_00354]|uniref:hypothetical protein n=1 Tax=Streptomyces sp. NBC_00354 TaxID=2975723 RepID=UPI002E271478
MSVTLCDDGGGYRAPPQPAATRIAPWDSTGPGLAHTGAQRGVVTTDVPFRMEIDLTRVDELL